MRVEEVEAEGMGDRLGRGVLRRSKASLRKTGKISYIEVVRVLREVTGQWICIRQVNQVASL